MWEHIEPRILQIDIYTELNEKNRKRALIGDPYIIQLNKIQEKVNVIIDFYRHLVMEVNPFDWENVLSGKATVYAYGETNSTTINEVFEDYYNCRYINNWSGRTCNY